MGALFFCSLAHESVVVLLGEASLASKSEAVPQCLYGTKVLD